MPFKLVDSDGPVPENTGKIQGNKPTKGQFEQGVSGNPKGRPKGSRNRASLLAEALLDGESEQITRKLIEKAKNGDLTAIKLCVDRLVPPRKSRPVPINLGKLETAEQISAAQTAILDVAAKGDITLEDAEKWCSLLDHKRASIETVELAAEVEAIKQHLGLGSKS